MVKQNKIIKGGETERQTETENPKNFESRWSRIGEILKSVSKSVYQFVSQSSIPSLSQSVSRAAEVRLLQSPSQSLPTSSAVSKLRAALCMSWGSFKIHASRLQRSQSPFSAACRWSCSEINI